MSGEIITVEAARKPESLVAALRSIIDRLNQRIAALERRVRELEQEA
jgi:polyhydroxyalkanoate synthesis regulator phasin